MPNLVHSKKHTSFTFCQLEKFEVKHPPRGKGLTVTPFGGNPTTVTRKTKSTSK